MKALDRCSSANNRQLLYSIWCHQSVCAAHRGRSWHPGPREWKVNPVTDVSSLSWLPVMLQRQHRRPPARLPLFCSLSAYKYIGEVNVHSMLGRVPRVRRPWAVYRRTPPPSFLSLPFRVTWFLEIDSPPPKSESWNRWNMNGSVVYEKGVWAEERRWGNCNCNLSVAKSLCLPVLWSLRKHTGRSKISSVHNKTFQTTY